MASAHFMFIGIDSQLVHPSVGWSLSLDFIWSRYLCVPDPVYNSISEIYPRKSPLWRQRYKS